MPHQGVSRAYSPLAAGPALNAERAFVDGRDADSSPHCPDRGRRPPWTGVILWSHADSHPGRCGSLRRSVGRATARQQRNLGPGARKRVSGQPRSTLLPCLFPAARRCQQPQEPLTLAPGGDQVTALSPGALSMGMW